MEPPPEDDARTKRFDREFQFREPHTEAETKKTPDRKKKKRIIIYIFIYIYIYIFAHEHTTPQHWLFAIATHPKHCCDPRQHTTTDTCFIASASHQSAGAGLSPSHVSRRRVSLQIPHVATGLPPTHDISERGCLTFFCVFNHAT